MKDKKKRAPVPFGEKYESMRERQRLFHDAMKEKRERRRELMKENTAQAKDTADKMARRISSGMKNTTAMGGTVRTEL